MKKNKIKKTTGDIIFDVVVYILIAFMIIVTLYPLIYCVSMSISDPIKAAQGKVWLLPQGFSWLSMGKVLNDPDILMYYKNTIFYTITGTAFGLLVTYLAAYPLSRKEFDYRRIFARIITFTMFFGGGLVPTYIVVTKFLHLYNSRWVLAITSACGAWYVMVARAYFESLPEGLFESARIDGASEYRIFAQLVVPLSKPIMAVLALYYAVSFWNSYFAPMLYLGDKKLWPLAVYLRQVLVSDISAESGFDVTLEQILSVLQLKYAVIVVAVLPMLLIYPLISKNLEKGLMIGAMKG